jgi:hypothetical protein
MRQTLETIWQFDRQTQTTARTASLQQRSVLWGHRCNAGPTLPALVRLGVLRLPAVLAQGAYRRAEVCCVRANRTIERDRNIQEEDAETTSHMLMRQSSATAPKATP